MKKDNELNENDKRSLLANILVPVSLFILSLTLFLFTSTAGEKFLILFNDIKGFGITDSVIFIFNALFYASIVGLFVSSIGGTLWSRVIIKNKASKYALKNKYAIALIIIIAIATVISIPLLLTLTYKTMFDVVDFIK